MNIKTFCVSWFQNIVFEGVLPFRETIVFLLKVLALSSLLVVFQPAWFVSFGGLGMNLLTLIVFVRPLSQIFTKLKILQTLTGLRKEIGIASGALIFAHGMGFFLAQKFSLPESLFQADLWNFSNLFGWGMIGIVVMIPVLLTSNFFSVKILGKKWKWIQRFTYLFFIFGSIHVAFVENEFGPIVLVFLWLIVWIFAYRKIVLWK